MKEALEILVRGSSLTSDQATLAMQTIMSGNASNAQIAAFLVGLAARGETVEELTALTQVMRSFATPVECEDPNAIDMCGTGGDSLGTFNISTTASFVCAGAGVTVAKHGNVGISSKCGSADVLQALGVNIGLDSANVGICLEEAGIGFIFARNFHPAMRHVMPVRKSLGVRTCFNILGPLCNPAGVRRQVVGAFSPEVAAKMVNILKNLGAAHVVTVSSHHGMDEFSLEGDTSYNEYLSSREAVASKTCSPSSLGLHYATASMLSGGDATQNAALLLSILSGKKGPHRDIVLLNSAFGLLVSGKFVDLEACLNGAQESIDSGAANKCLENLIRVSGSLA